jgi:hypothetical protein
MLLPTEDPLHHALAANTALTSSRMLGLPGTCKFRSLTEDAVGDRELTRHDGPFVSHQVFTLPCDHMCRQARESRPRALGRADRLHRFIIKAEVSSRLNGQLAACILEREAAAGGAEVSKTNVGGFQSEPTLFEEATGPLHELHTIASLALEEISADHTDPDSATRPESGAVHPACTQLTF